MSQFASLPTKQRVSMAPSSTCEPDDNDKIIANNAVPDMYRRVLVTVDTSVVQTTRTTNVAIVANADILDRAVLSIITLATIEPVAEACLLE